LIVNQLIKIKAKSIADYSHLNTRVNLKWISNKINIKPADDPEGYRSPTNFTISVDKTRLQDTSYVYRRYLNVRIRNFLNFKLKPVSGNASKVASSARFLPLKYPRSTNPGKLFSTVDTNVNRGTPSFPTKKILIKISNDG